MALFIIDKTVQGENYLEIFIKYFWLNIFSLENSEKFYFQPD